MRNMLKIMHTLLSSGNDLVLVTVIASSGATPRGAGARMLIGKSGRICGTIGGGAVEYRSEQIAAQVLKEKTSLGHAFTLTKDDVQNLGMICGGACDVFFHYIPAADSHTLTLCEKAEAEFCKGHDLWLLTDVGMAIPWACIHRKAAFGVSVPERIWFCPGTRSESAICFQNSSTHPEGSIFLAAVTSPRSWCLCFPM